MANPDFNILLNALYPIAKELLEQQQDFLPFGRAMSSEGEVLTLDVVASGGPPTTEQGVDLLEKRMREMARKGEIRASGICFDALVNKPGSTARREVICARLEHLSGEALDAFLPYEKRGATIEYGEVFAGAGKAVVFPGIKKRKG